MSTPGIPIIAADSTQAGFLAPGNRYGALEDQDLRRFLQQMVAGVSGLPGELVRPRWVPEPANEPPFEVDWAAIGAESRDPDTFAYEGLLPDGSQGVIRHELLNLLASFYGPHGEMNAETFSMGMAVAQNREYLTRQGYGLVEVGKPVQASVLRNERYLYGFDVPLVIRRRQQFAYPVQDLVAASVELIVDQPAYTKTFQVSQEE